MALKDPKREKTVEGEKPHAMFEDLGRHSAPEHVASPSPVSLLDPFVEGHHRRQKFHPYKLRNSVPDVLLKSP